MKVMAHTYTNLLNKQHRTVYSCCCSL